MFEVGFRFFGTRKHAWNYASEQFSATEPSGKFADCMHNLLIKVNHVLIQTRIHSVFLRSAPTSRLDHLLNASERPNQVVHEYINSE